MKFTPTLGGSLSGSLGGMTASHNRGGAYLRRRSTPVNPNTPRQQIVRATLGGLVQAWNNVLNDAERQGWRDWAANTPITDRIGQTITLTGQAAYTRLNTPRGQAMASGLTEASSLARVDAPPIIFNTGEPVLSLSLVGFDSTTDTFSLTGDLAAPASEAGVVLLYVGAAQNLGVTYFKGPYQLAAGTAITATDEDFTLTADVTDGTAWVSAAIPGVGQRLPVRVIVAYDDGRVSQQFSVLATVTDTSP